MKNVNVNKVTAGQLRKLSTTEAKLVKGGASRGGARNSKKSCRKGDRVCNLG